MMVSLIGFFMAFWNFNNFDNFIVTTLFMLEKSQNERRFMKDADLMLQRKLSNQRECIRTLIPCCFRFERCSLSRTERALKLGRERLEQETNIIEIIKARRFFQSALSLLLTKDQHKRLKEQSRF